MYLFSKKKEKKRKKLQAHKKYLENGNAACEHNIPLFFMEYKNFNNDQMVGIQ
jgi:hypothetical protein